MLYRKQQGQSISIHPPRVGRDLVGAVGEDEVIQISIHPPRVGRDDGGIALSVPFGISIHPPRVGRDASIRPSMGRESPFQSTLPVWGGTRACTSGRSRSLDFNPPSPCGEGPGQTAVDSQLNQFQSTLPVWGGTATLPVKLYRHRGFQSTLPVWGGTCCGIPSPAT